MMRRSHHKGNLIKHFQSNKLDQKKKFQDIYFSQIQ